MVAPTPPAGPVPAALVRPPDTPSFTRSRTRSRAPGRPLARSLSRALRALLVALLAVPVVALTQASPVGASPLLNESFRNGTVAGSNWVVGGSSTPCLTASGSGSSVPGRCSGASDAAGSGALRLTPAEDNKTGFVMWNSPLATSAGLDISFRQFQYGGDGADGIAFFIADGAHALTAPGAFGGSLGYHNRVPSPAANGLPNALLGIGLDAFGNFAGESTNPLCTPPANTGNAAYPNSVTVRGPGNGATGYCILGGPTTSPSTLRADRASGGRLVRVKVDDNSVGSPKVTVWIDGSQVVQVDRPALSSSFKFGFSASTGDSNDVHEIRDLQVGTVTTLAPAFEGSVSGPSSAVPAGSAFTSTVSSGLTTAGGSVPSTDTVTMTITSPGGFTGTPSGTGWNCANPAAGATTTTCTRSGSNADVPGSSYPPVTVPAKAPTDSGTSSGVSVSISAPGATPLNQSSSSYTVNPDASDLETRIESTSSPAAVPIVLPAPTGTGPFTWSIVSPPGAGTAAFPSSSTGTVSYTPPADHTTPVTFTYRVTDGGGRQSAPATVTVRFSVEGPAVSSSTTAGTAVTFAGPTQSGNPTITSRSIAVAPSGGQGTAAWVGNQLRFTPAPGFSGTATFRYLETAANGTEYVGDVTVTVAPTLIAPASLVTSQEADGTVTATSGAPTPNGVGPHTYSIVTPPSHGSATIDPATGQVTYTSDPGWSGTDAVAVKVTSAGGDSPPVTLPVTVRPYSSAVSGSTSTGSTVVLDAPTPVGTGPFTYTVTSPAGGTATIAADGAITLTTTATSGLLSFSYTLTDGNGVTSAPIPVTVAVAPTASDLSGPGTADATGAAPVTFTPAPVGTGPFTYAVSSSPTAGEGTAAVVGSTIEVTPAPGFSGPLTFTYTATDADGIESEPQIVTVLVAPTAPTAQVNGTSGAARTRQLPEPVGVGPFTWEVVTDLPTGVGTVSIDEHGLMTIDVDPNHSGDWTVSYRVVDASGLASAPADVEVEVVPGVVDPPRPRLISTPASATPEPVTVATPTPHGTGPFTFVMVSGPDPEGGTATIDPDTGEITFVPVAGASGRFTMTYAVTDASGNVSEPIEVEVLLAPNSLPPGATPPTASTVGTNPVTMQAATPVGTGPFTYRIATPPPPEQGTVTIDPVTGEITFTPADGFVGTASFSYEVVDADGVVSDPVTATVDVAAAPVTPSGTPAAPGSLAATPVSPTGGGAPRRLALTGGGVGLLTALGAVLAGAGAALSALSAAWRRLLPRRP